MRSTFRALCALFLFCGACFAQATKINPVSQINWPMTSGSGAPTASCSSTNFGQPYTDTTNNHQYACMGSGWVQVGATGSTAFSALTPGINTSAAMVVGVGGSLNINQTGGSVTAPANTDFFAASASGTASRLAAISYGSTSFFSAVGYGGTQSSPTAISSGTQIGGWNAWAYNGTGLNGPIAAFRCFANQTQTMGAGGSYCDVATTPNGSLTESSILRFENDGGVDTTGVTGGDQGPGTINAAGLYVNGTAVGMSTGTTVDILSDQKASGTPFYQTNEYLAVAANQTVTILSRTGAGYVSSLFLAFQSSTNYQSAVLNVYVNGDSSPSISGPVRDYLENAWANSGFAGNKFFAFNGSANGGESSTLAIPFNSGITITVTVPAADTIWSDVMGNTASDSWPNTRKLWASIVDSPTPSTVNGLSFAPYTYETLVNHAGSNPGRLVGVYALDDSTSLSTVHASLEGNVAIYTDAFNATWAATTAFTSGQIIMDPCGNFQTVTTGGTTGSTEPACSSWANISGHTTTDGTVTWTASVGTPLNIWRASKPYSALGMSFLDQNGNVETVTTTGTSAATEPTYPTGGSCPGATTTDGTVVETCSLGSTMVAAAFVSTGTEDFFNLGFYAISAGTNSQGNGGTSGIFWTIGDKIGFYRFFLNDPIRFNHSIGIIRQIGDSSETGGPFTGNALEMAATYFYTQDTN